MKRLDQSVIDAAQRCADDRVAQSPRILTKRGAAEYMPERIAWEAMNAIVPERLEEIMKLFTNAQAKGRLDNWLERRHSDGIARRDILLEIVAIALDRGELPPKPLCEWAAKVLRGLIKDNARGTLLYRDACIAGLLIDLESWDFTLFPNPAGKRQGQVYGCDIVIEAFKKIDIDLTVDIIKNVWKEWSHRWAHHRRPLCS